MDGGLAHFRASADAAVDFEIDYCRYCLKAPAWAAGDRRRAAAWGGRGAAAPPGATGSGAGVGCAVGSWLWLLKRRCCCRCCWRGGGRAEIPFRQPPPDRGGDNIPHHQRHSTVDVCYRRQVERSVPDLTRKMKKFYCLPAQCLCYYAVAVVLTGGRRCRQPQVD